VVEGAALEMLCRATYRGFESHLLRYLATEAPVSIETGASLWINVIYFRRTRLGTSGYPTDSIANCDRQRDVPPTFCESVRDERSPHRATDRQPIKLPPNLAMARAANYRSVRQSPFSVDRLEPQDPLPAIVADFHRERNLPS
jgi:hypothetical protein